MGLLVSAVCSLLLFAAPGAGSAGAERVTQPFRDDHVVIREHLGHMELMSAQVRTARDPRPLMRHLVEALREHIGVHAAWEEQVLYPVVDRQASGDSVFTASMRHEHRIVERWIGELEGMAAADEVDPAAFAARADQLLGLISAHFEVEEEVLLPVLDNSLSAEQFQVEVLDKLPEH